MTKVNEVVLRAEPPRSLGFYQRDAAFALRSLRQLVSNELDSVGQLSLIAGIDQSNTEEVGRDQGSATAASYLRKTRAPSSIVDGT